MHLVRVVPCSLSLVLTFLSDVIAVVLFVVVLLVVFNAPVVAAIERVPVLVFAFFEFVAFAPDVVAIEALLMISN
jgi:hypothetical protein